MAKKTNPPSGGEPQITVERLVLVAAMALGGTGTYQGLKEPDHKHEGLDQIATMQQRIETVADNLEKIENALGEELDKIEGSLGEADDRLRVNLRDGDAELREEVNSLRERMRRFEIFSPPPGTAADGS